MISQTPLGRLCELKDGIEPIMYLLSEHSSMVTGTVNLIDVGLLPKLLMHTLDGLTFFASA